MTKQPEGNSRPISHRRDGLVSALVCTAIFFSATGCAARYPTRSFLELQDRLKRGNTIYVLEVNGAETRGKFVEASETALTLDVHGLRRQIERAAIHQVDRNGDSLWSGFLIGAGLGTINALMTDPGPDGKMHSGARVAGIGVLGAAGAGIDAAISHRSVIYLAPVRSRDVDRIHGIRSTSLDL